MVGHMEIGARKRQQVGLNVLPQEEWQSKYNMNSSDFAGFVQLAYHVGCALAAAYVIHRSFGTESNSFEVQNAQVHSWNPFAQVHNVPLFILGEVMLGFISSFYFMGFHELVHNTAFRTSSINTGLAKVVGVMIFRGSDWFWCFHCLHHRYTQDPKKDPELSGGSSDLIDPTKGVFAYMRFLTGWPFGFERALNMVKMALGLKVDPWVNDMGQESEVRKESQIYVLIYILLTVGSLLNEQVRTVVLFYWLLPHILGSGHLRFYQFAEHRACETGTYTDLDAWGASRTTSTWFFYRRLAWNMPFHIEHHAWPTVPFNLLPDIHERIKSTQPENRCLIAGKSGYLAIHSDFLRRVIKGEPVTKSVEPEDKTESAEPAEDNPQNALNGFSLNRLNDEAAMAQLPAFTPEEVKKHNTATDCWVTVKAKGRTDSIVVDITSFLAVHPGGPNIISSKAGTDVSAPFNMIHQEGTLEGNLPDKCLVGILDTSGRKSTLTAPLLQ